MPGVWSNPSTRGRRGRWQRVPLQRCRLAGRAEREERGPTVLACGGATWAPGAPYGGARDLPGVQVLDAKTPGECKGQQALTPRLRHRAQAASTVMDRCEGAGKKLSPAPRPLAELAYFLLCLSTRPGTILATGQQTTTGKVESVTHRGNGASHGDAGSGGPAGPGRARQRCWRRKGESDAGNA